MGLDDAMETEEPKQQYTIQAKFVSDTGEDVGDPLDLPIEITTKQLELICNAILKNEEHTPYIFFVNDEEIKENLELSLDKKKTDFESVLSIVYQPQAVFRVRPVTRCTSSLPGHSEAVVSVRFSPNGKALASGSGDTTLRLWDLNTETPQFTCKGHTSWVLVVDWSPDGKKIASADKTGRMIIWDPNTGQQMGKPMTDHKKWITSLSWEPYHVNPECRRIASAGKDNVARIWDTVLCRCLLTLAGHTQTVTCVKWGGAGLIFTSSQDRSVKMWRADDGVMCRTFAGHAHWVNSIALNTDYVLRTGPFHPVLDQRETYQPTKNTDELKERALERFKKVCPDNVESFVSCSDDFTLYLWKTDSKTFVTRMTGHQNVVSDVKYSPDVKFIASASFDKSIRLWRAHDGSFYCVLRGHVNAVYQLAWSADSRLLVSGSKDSTVKGEKKLFTLKFVRPRILYKHILTEEINIETILF